MRNLKGLQEHVLFLEDVVEKYFVAAGASIEPSKEELWRLIYSAKSVCCSYREEMGMDMRVAPVIPISLPKAPLLVPQEGDEDSASRVDGPPPVEAPFPGEDSVIAAQFGGDYDDVRESLETWKNLDKELNTLFSQEINRDQVQTIESL